VSKLTVVVLDEGDLARICCGFARIEFGPDDYSEVEAAWQSAAAHVQDEYLREARKYIDVLRKRGLDAQSNPGGEK